MRKKIYMIIAIVAITLIMAICLVACGKTRDIHIKGIDLIYIETVKNGLLEGYTLYYDKETNVMYMAIRQGYGFGITPLYNADGTLKLYEEE